MFCQPCGAQLSDSANLCTVCGKPVPSATAPSAQEPVASAAVSYAGFWRRVWAVLFDTIILSAGALFLAFVIYGPPSEQMTPRQAQQWGKDIRDIAQFVALVGWWLYFGLLESSRWQATLGKKAIGIMVTDSNGKRISFGRATGRHFAKLVSTLTVGVGYLMAGFTAKKQALHDIIADCLVVTSPTQKSA